VLYKNPILIVLAQFQVNYKLLKIQILCKPLAEKPRREKKMVVLYFLPSISLSELTGLVVEFSILFQYGQIKENLIQKLPATFNATGKKKYINGEVAR
jgi:hypothetical protein